MRRFMQQQMALPPLPTKQKIAAYRGRRRREAGRVAMPSSLLIEDLTPRCLKDGSQVRGGGGVAGVGGDGGGLALEEEEEEEGRTHSY